MAAAETVEITRGIDDNVKVIDGNVKGVGEQLQNVDKKVEGVDHKIGSVAKGELELHELPPNLSLLLR